MRLAIGPAAEQRQVVKLGACRYWYFDDLELYPLDVWPVPLTTGDRPYGVNPEGLLATRFEVALSSWLYRHMEPQGNMNSC